MVTAEEILEGLKILVEPTDSPRAAEAKEIVLAALHEVPEETLMKIHKVSDELGFFAQECVPFLSDETKRRILTVNTVVLNGTVMYLLCGFRRLTKPA